VAARDDTILQGGRAKAYRPIPERERRRAIEAGLRAYADDDWFLAHELLEPAWMGTRDLAERELLQGLIKLAAAFVHGARSNPAGVAKNLRGARERLLAGRDAGAQVGVDVDELLARLDSSLAAPGGPPISIPWIDSSVQPRIELPIEARIEPDGHSPQE
jgi:predicted metal-dependent hydrolase